MTRPNMLAVAGVLLVPALLLWAVLFYVCHQLVAGAAVVLDIIIISRSL